MDQKSIIFIEGMSCMHCEKAVKNTIKNVNGVIEVNIDLMGGKAEVAYNPDETSAREIIDAINNLETYKAHE